MKKNLKIINVFGGDLFSWNHEGKIMLLEIWNDEYPQDPRDAINFDNLTTMFCFHDRLLLGDRRSRSWDEAADCLITFFNEKRQEESLDLFENYIRKAEELSESPDGFVERLAFFLKPLGILVKPMYLYEHSQIVVSGSRVGRYPSPVGFIIAEKDRILSETGCAEEKWEEKANAVIDGEIEEYGYYFSEEVYGFTLYEKDGDNWKEIDQCAGFYGSDLKKNGILDYVDGLKEAIENKSYVTGKLREETVVIKHFDLDGEGEASL